MLVCFRHMLLDIGPSIGVWAPLGATPLKTTDFLFPRSHHLSIAPQLEWELRTPPLNAKMLVSLILCGVSAGNAVVEVRMCKSPAKSQRHCFVPSLCLESLYPIFLHEGDVDAPFVACIPQTLSLCALVSCERLCESPSTVQSHFSDDSSELH